MGRSGRDRRPRRFTVQRFAICPPGVRQVIFNQNVYLTVDSLAAGGAAAAAPYSDNPDLASVVGGGRSDSAEVLRVRIPERPDQAHGHYGLDPAIHHPPAEPAGQAPRLHAAPARRRGGARVLRLLELHGALDGWEVVAIEGRSETQAADLLRSSRIFLSFSELEGFGLPPCEALACGCLVGWLRRLRGPGVLPSLRSRVAGRGDGDVFGFARRVEGTDPAGPRRIPPQHEGRQRGGDGRFRSSEHYSAGCGAAGSPGGLRAPAAGLSAALTVTPRCPRSVEAERHGRLVGVVDPDDPGVPVIQRRAVDVDRSHEPWTISSRCP